MSRRLVDSAPCVSLITNSRPACDSSRTRSGSPFMIRSVSDIREPTTARGINEIASAASQPFVPQSAGSANQTHGQRSDRARQAPEYLVPCWGIHLVRIEPRVVIEDQQGGRDQEHGGRGQHDQARPERIIGRYPGGDRDQYEGFGDLEVRAKAQPV